MTVIEYIIVHELTHLLESNHTQEFWNRVAAQLPNYDKAKNWLKEYGFELERDFQQGYFMQNKIDAIVKVVRFPGWQTTTSGEREVQKSLRKALLKYKLHKDQALFERAYAYIKAYYWKILNNIYRKQ